MKKRRIKKGTLPPVSELKYRANKLGMTISEYVDFKAQIHRSREGRKPSAYYDLGPEAYKNKSGIYDRKKKGTKP